MTVIKRHWHQGLMTMIALVGVTITLLLTSPTIPPEVASAQSVEPPVALDSDVYFAVDQLRRELALTDQDLAAMGCSGETVEAALTALVGWYQTNAAVLRDIDRDRQLAKVAEAEARRARRTGEATTDSKRLIAESREEAVSLGQTRYQMLQGAVVSVESMLSFEQRNVWANARSNKALPRRYRYMSGITREVCAELGEAKRAAKVAGEPTRMADERVLYRSQLDEQVLAQARASAGLPSVREAVTRVLPEPPEVVAELEARLQAEVEPESGQ